MTKMKYLWYTYREEYKIENELPGAIVQYTDLNHEEITSGYSQWEFLAGYHWFDIVRMGQLFQHVTTEPHGLQNHWKETRDS